MELNDSQIMNFTSICNNLVNVSLTSNLSITDEGIINGLFKNCPNLECLDLHGCRAVRGLFLTKLPAKLIILLWAFLDYVNHILKLEFVFKYAIFKIIFF